MLYNPYSYRITIDEKPIPLQRICVLSYRCLLLTKVLFETSFKSFQYNTEVRHLSNYSIKLILCSHCLSMCKGLCQNKKQVFDQYTKGGNFCAAHMTLSKSLYIFQLLGEFHCWWTKESPRAHLAKFYGQLWLICSVLKASKFSVLKLIEIVILWVYYTIPFGFSFFRHFWGIIFQFLSTTFFG